MTRCSRSAASTSERGITRDTLHATSVSLDAQHQHILTRIFEASWRPLPGSAAESELAEQRRQEELTARSARAGDGDEEEDSDEEEDEDTPLVDEEEEEEDEDEDEEQYNDPWLVDDFDLSDGDEDPGEAALEVDVGPLAMPPEGEAEAESGHAGGVGIAGQAGSIAGSAAEAHTFLVREATLGGNTDVQMCAPPHRRSEVGYAYQLYCVGASYRRDDSGARLHARTVPRL